MQTGPGINLLCFFKIRFYSIAVAIGFFTSFNLFSDNCIVSLLIEHCETFKRS